MRRAVYRDIRLRSADDAVIVTSLELLIVSGLVAVRVGSFPVIPTPWSVLLRVLALLLGLVSWRIGHTINRSGTAP